MAQITYNNKTYLNENPSIANENKITDSDMNEIKSVVNTNATTLDNLSPQCITLETNATGSITGVTKIPIKSIRNQIGTQITANTTTNRIIIGSGVSHVMITAQVQGAITNNPAIIEIRKNGTQIKRSYMPIADSYQTISILPFIESVTNGDYFELYLSEGTLNVSGGLSNATLCYMTISKID